MNLRFATITPAAEQRIRDLAVAAYPNEGCGVLLGRRDGTRMVIVDVTSARNMWTERAAGARPRPRRLHEGRSDGRSRGLDVVGISAQPSRSPRASRRVRHGPRLGGLRLHHLQNDGRRIRGPQRLRARRGRRAVRADLSGHLAGPGRGAITGRRHAPAPARGG